MQPYFFPYIGYFQLMAASDIFVGFDTAQYIKRGWVNRNRVLDVKGEAAWITLPVVADDQRLVIRQRAYILGGAERILRRIKNAYHKAPYFDATFYLIQEIMRTPEPNVATFNMRLLGRIADRLGIRKPRLLASSLSTTRGLIGGEARVIDLCKRLGATGYLNLIGGRDLYRAPHFQAHGLSLGFLETAVEPQAGQSHLSIIHMLMTESEEALANLLTRYRITGG